MQQAIKKAREGGYISINLSPEIFSEGNLLIDPLFWKALGKTEGWNKGVPRQISNGEWKYQMHCFIDHIISGGSVDSFFNNLLK